MEEEWGGQGRLQSGMARRGLREGQRGARGRVEVRGPGGARSHVEVRGPGGGQGPCGGERARGLRRRR